MNALAQSAALLAAVAHIVTAPLELIYFERPAVRRFLHVQADNVKDVRMWAFVVGFRNLLVGVGTIIGLVILHEGDEMVGTVLVLTACGYMVLAGLAMGIADALGLWRPHGGSVVGTVGSSVPPLVALIAAAG